jgi:hypothetical protein
LDIIFNDVSRPFGIYTQLMGGDFYRSECLCQFADKNLKCIQGFTLLLLNPLRRLTFYKICAENRKSACNHTSYFIRIKELTEKLKVYNNQIFFLFHKCLHSWTFILWVNTQKTISRKLKMNLEMRANINVTETKTLRTRL